MMVKDDIFEGRRSNEIRASQSLSSFQKISVYFIISMFRKHFYGYLYAGQSKYVLSILYSTFGHSYWP